MSLKKKGILSYFEVSDGKVFLNHNHNNNHKHHIVESEDAYILISSIKVNFDILKLF